VAARLDQGEILGWFQGRSEFGPRALGNRSILGDPGTAAIADRINEQIAAGSVKNRGGNAVEEKIDAGLLREDKKFLYPIRDDIPIMLEDEAIPFHEVQES